jgi:hypothetical protein
MRELEAIAEALRAEVALKDEALAAARDSVEAANGRVRELQGELDANAAVFDLRARRGAGRAQGAASSACPACRCQGPAGARLTPHPDGTPGSTPAHALPPSPSPRPRAPQITRR